MKLVSVITPVFNSESYIERFLQSILWQDHEEIELIIVNDGSEDNSVNIIEKNMFLFEDRDIKVIIINQNNMGAAAAVKAGLEIASGEFLIWPDSDDWLFPKSISRRVEVLLKTDADVVVTDSYISNDFEDYTASGVHFVKLPENERRVRVRSVIERKLSVQPVGVMVRKSVVEKLNIMDFFYISREGQNLQLFIPLLYSAKWIKLDEVLQTIMSHSESHSRSKRSFIDECKREFEIKKIIDTTLRNDLNIKKSDRDYFLRLSNLNFIKVLSLCFLKRIGVFDFLNILRRAF